MYGMIHQAARDLALSRMGREEWDALLDDAGLSSRHFISMEYYSDEDTMRLVAAIARRMDCDVAAALEVFGRSWIDFAGASVYGRVLSLAGGDLAAFIANLDRMHASIKSAMPQAELPGFEVVSSDAHGIHVIYRSTRVGLEPFVRGILAAVAERFGESVDVDWRPGDGGGVLFVLARRDAERRRA